MSSSSKEAMHLASVILSYLLSFSMACSTVLKWSSACSASSSPPLSSSAFITSPASRTSPSNPAARPSPSFRESRRSLRRKGRTTLRGQQTSWVVRWPRERGSSWVCRKLRRQRSWRTIWATWKLSRIMSFSAICARVRWWQSKIRQQLYPASFSSADSSAGATPSARPYCTAIPQNRTRQVQEQARSWSRQSRKLSISERGRWAQAWTMQGQSPRQARKMRQPRCPARSPPTSPSSSISSNSHSTFFSIASATSAMLRACDCVTNLSIRLLYFSRSLRLNGTTQKSSPCFRTNSLCIASNTAAVLTDPPATLPGRNCLTLRQCPSSSLAEMNSRPRRSRLRAEGTMRQSRSWRRRAVQLTTRTRQSSNSPFSLRQPLSRVRSRASSRQVLSKASRKSSLRGEAKAVRRKQRRERWASARGRSRLSRYSSRRRLTSSYLCGGSTMRKAKLGLRRFLRSQSLSGSTQRSLSMYSQLFRSFWQWMMLMQGHSSPASFIRRVYSFSPRIISYSYTSFSNPHPSTAIRFELRNPSTKRLARYHSYTELASNSTPYSEYEMWISSLNSRSFIDLNKATLQMAALRDEMLSLRLTREESPRCISVCMQQIVEEGRR